MSRQLRLGPFSLVRMLEPSVLAERWVALHDRDGSNHTLYRLPACRDSAERRKVLAALEAASDVRHPHLLSVEQYGFAPDGRPWIVTPYLGNQEGLVTLGDLIEKKGQMSAAEVERCMHQLLSAIDGAHGLGVHHGPVELDEVLVDRRGSVSIELFGLGRMLAGLERANEELARDEVRRVVEIGYRLLTGLVAEEPRLRAGRIVKRLDRAWDGWFDTGLEASSGFASAADAIAALPSGPRPIDPVDAGPAPVRTVIRRLRRSFLAGAGETPGER